MLIVEEYLKRNNIDLDVVKYDHNGAFLFEYQNNKHVMTYTWNPPTYWPGFYHFEFFRFNGVHIQNDFIKYYNLTDELSKYDKTFCTYDHKEQKVENRVYFDQFEPAIRHIVSFFKSKVPENQVDANLFSWDIFIKGLDNYFVNCVSKIKDKSKFLNCVYESLNLTNDSYKRYEYSKTVTRFLEHDIHLMDFKIRLHRLTDKFSQWLALYNNKLVSNEK